LKASLAIGELATPVTTPTTRGRFVANVVRAALLQTKWTGDTDSMVEAHEKFAHEAAAQGAQIMGLQEVFNSPYFCQVQDNEHFRWAEPVPDGPTIRRMQSVARETGMVLVVPIFEVEQAGLYFNCAAVIDADGAYLGKYRKHHIPQVKGFWEKFYFRPGNLGWPVFETAVGRVGVYICYDRHFPEGWRALGLAGAQVVYNPSATSRGLSAYLWKLEQPAAAVANEYFIAAINRVGVEPYGDNDFYGTSYFVDPRGQFVGDLASDQEEELVVRDLDLDLIEEVRQLWAFYRDRRPEAYDPLTAG
jgi:N-carbamoylputrescine amidase